MEIKRVNTLQEFSLFKLTLDPAAGYMVKQNEIAIGQHSIATAGLYTCVGLVIAQAGKLLLAHVDAKGNVGQLAYTLQQHFDPSKAMVVKIINGSPQIDPMTGYATQKCLDAIKAAGISTQPLFPSVNGGFMATVFVSPDGSEFSRMKGDKQEPQPSSLLREQTTRFAIQFLNGKSDNSQ